MSTTNNSASNSRYYGVETGEFQAADGTAIPYLRRRFIPQPERFAVLGTHTLRDNERLDNIAAQYIGDPEQYWKICDGNGAMSARELETAPQSDDLEASQINLGKEIVITLPEGIPGTPTSL